MTKKPHSKTIEMNEWRNERTNERTEINDTKIIMRMCTCAHTIIAQIHKLRMAKVLFTCVLFAAHTSIYLCGVCDSRFPISQPNTISHTHTNAVTRTHAHRSIPYTFLRSISPSPSFIHSYFLCLIFYRIFNCRRWSSDQHCVSMAQNKN